MKIQVISDTHGRHKDIRIDKNIDCIIHAGDSTNYRELFLNQLEFDDFLEWFSALNVKHKIIIAGNHDRWSLKKYNIDKLKDLGIIYLEHEYCDIDGIMFFGSPYTPTFGNWFHMKQRYNLDEYWKMIDDNSVDVLITHGPPQGILDGNIEGRGYYEQCGDIALLKNVFRIKPKYHVFGHIHDSKKCYNNGIFIRNNINFINASCVTDGKIEEGEVTDGYIFTIKK